MQAGRASRKTNPLELAKTRRGQRTNPLELVHEIQGICLSPGSCPAPGQSFRFEDLIDRPYDAAVVPPNMRSTPSVPSAVQAAVDAATAEVARFDIECLARLRRQLHDRDGAGVRRQVVVVETGAGDPGHGRRAEDCHLEDEDAFLPLGYWNYLQQPFPQVRKVFSCSFRAVSRPTHRRIEA